MAAILQTFDETNMLFVSFPAFGFQQFNISGGIE